MPRRLSRITAAQRATQAAELVLLTAFAVGCAVFAAFQP